MFRFRIIEGSLLSPMNCTSCCMYYDKKIYEINCRRLSLNYQFQSIRKITTISRFAFMGVIHGVDTGTFYYINTIFEKKSAGWPSGQRCELAIVGSRVRFQPKSKFLWRNQKSRSTHCL